MRKSLVWQCKCGHIEYDDMPEDCEKCFAVGKFKPVSDDVLEDLESEEILSGRSFDDED